jgi:hypothetical protein
MIMHTIESACRGTPFVKLALVVLLVLAALSLLAVYAGAASAPATPTPGVCTPPVPVATPGAQLYHYYLPDIRMPASPVTYEIHRGFLAQNVNMRHLAMSYEQAIAGPPTYVWNGGNQYAASVYRASPGDPWTANRAFLRYDLPAVESSRVVSAALVLYPAIANTEPGTATLRCGTWSGTPGAGDWDAFGAPLVTFRPVELGWTWPYTLPIDWDDLVACNGQLALVVDEAAAPGLPPGTRLFAGFVNDTSGLTNPQPWTSHVRVVVKKEDVP